MIKLKKFEDNYNMDTIEMVKDFFNFHRKLTKSPEEFYVSYEEAKESLDDWIKEGQVINIFQNEDLAGFVFLKFTENKTAFLEDIYIKEEFRNSGIGKQVLNEIDNMAKEKGIKSMFVSVIPRNISALNFYIECGFDHLNMIELRKNYDESLNKSEEVNILGYKLKKY
ncbi:MAG: GNAT family N-acetyltransferase [Bacillota bacterium]|nr:GNAT family N-acetyltransferase [Bacillota bacterium]